jgi:uncharacterized protein (TIGR02246 family)
VEEAMRRIVRSAIAVVVLIAWALPCHDAEAKGKFARNHAAGAGGKKPAAVQAEADSVQAGKANAVQAAAADSVQARKSVDEGNANFVRAWMTGDAGLFADCFAADGALLQPGRPALVGRERIRDRMKAVFAKYRMTEGEITTIDVYILGDAAYETGKWKFAIGPIGQPAEPDSGRYIEVWKRVGEGWKMWRDISVPE